MIQAISIHLENGTKLHWDFEFSVHGTMRLTNVFLSGVPEWIKLENFQCPACTLDPAESPTCPVAEVLAKYAHDLADHKSFEKVKVEVFQKDQQQFTLSNVPLQRVVGELVRLAAFQYECPIGRKIKPAMAELPPFPTNDEILEAFAKAFADESENGQLNSDEVALLENLHDLFGNLSVRLDQVGRGDAHLNGVVILHSLSVLFSLSAPEQIGKIKLNSNNG
jgi:hypothetical protein